MPRPDLPRCPQAAQVSGVDQGERGALRVKAQLADEDVSLPSEERSVGAGARAENRLNW